MFGEFIRQNDIYGIQRLLKIKANLDDRFFDGHSHVHVGVIHGAVDCIEFLIRQKANINTYSNCSGSPLHLAIRFQQTSNILLLLEAKADVTLPPPKPELEYDTYDTWSIAHYCHYCQMETILPTIQQYGMVSKLSPEEIFNIHD